MLTDAVSLAIFGAFVPRVIRSPGKFSFQAAELADTTSRDLKLCRRTPWLPLRHLFFLLILV